MSSHCPCFRSCFAACKVEKVCLVSARTNALRLLNIPAKHSDRRPSMLTEAALQPVRSSLHGLFRCVPSEPFLSHSKRYLTAGRAFSPYHRAILITDHRSRDGDDDVARPFSKAEQTELEHRMRPFVVTAPQPSDLYPVPLRFRTSGTLAKARRAAPAIALHDRLAAQPDTVCVYTDGSVAYEHLGGAGAIIPSLNKAALLNIGLMEQIRRTTIAELNGIGLGAELAAKYAPAGTKVALFTDFQMEKPLWQTDWADPDTQRAFARFETAVNTLDARASPLSIYWVPGHRDMIEGTALAHRIAAEANRVAPDAVTRLLLAPVLSAGVAFDHVGVLSVPGRGHEFVIPSYPRRVRRGHVKLDGLATVVTYPDVCQRYQRLNSPRALAYHIQAISRAANMSR